MRQAAARFLHITDERRAQRLLRIGIPAPRHRRGALDGAVFPRAVFCVPFALQLSMTADWLRELKHRPYRGVRAIEFYIGDGEEVALRYGERQLEPMTAGEAVAFFLWTADARGFEVLVPRAILPREIARILALPATRRFHAAAAAARFSRKRSSGLKGSWRAAGI